MKYSVKKHSIFCDKKPRFKFTGKDIWFRKQIELFNKASSTNKLVRPSTIFNLIENLENVSLLDFGSGTGHLGVHLEKNFPSKFKLIYLYDRRNMIDKFNEVHNSKIIIALKAKKLYCNLPPADIFYSNSTIQYLKNLDPLLRMISRNRYKHILLDDVMISPTKNLTVYQKYFGNFKKFRFYAKEDILSKFEKLGYNLEFQRNYPLKLPNNWAWTLQTKNNIIELPNPITLMFTLA
jgi:putative methyltransferase (TIGR04325 family)